MSGLTLKLSAAPQRRLDMSRLVPGLLAGLTTAEVERLPIADGNRPLSVGDVFQVAGTPGERLTIEGATDRLDYLGAEHSGGDIIVEGDAGGYAGRRMRSGRLEIRGNAGEALASNMRGGLIVVAGNAARRLGTPRPGEKDGMAGGSVVIKGDAGDFCGERMRRGTIVVKGRIGSHAGARMMGGTIYAEQGLGEAAGMQMRRGTLIAPNVAQPLATFADCGRHDLLILRIMAAHWVATLGDLAPPALSPSAAAPRRLMGDMASLGKGEILLTGA